MNRSTKQIPSRLRSWLFAGTAATAIVVASVWYWSRPSAKLNQRGYDVTIALYQVCNQRNAEGLAEIEELIAGDEPNRAIRNVVAQAKSGDWSDAAVACRQLLEDQVQR